MVNILSKIFKIKSIQTRFHIFGPAEISGAVWANKLVLVRRSAHTFIPVPGSIGTVALTVELGESGA